MDRVQTLVIGAGVVGLACARALARSGREVIIAESAGAIGTGTSSRNSEVVHAGIYYPTGSLKARHCVRGAQMLLDFCAAHGIRHRVCGKLIVATSEAQRAELLSISSRARANGVHLRRLCPQEVRDMEPQVFCVEALHSPRTGIVDSHGFMEALLRDAQEAGAVLALKTSVRPGGQLLSKGGVFVELDSAGDTFGLEAQEVVNCAGLSAPRVAQHLGLPVSDLPTPHFCRGSYYALQGVEGIARRPFSRLVYPVPEPNTSGLGIHATVDLSGEVRFGPDVEWLASELPGGMAVDEAAYSEGAPSAVAYAVDTARSKAFYGEVRRYWPDLPDGALVADYSGIRPKLSARGEAAADFRVEGAGLQPGGSPRLVNLFGIESPGLTSALSLAEHIVQILGHVR